eukprot:6212750-Pleurochrysis_carterae.AAC.4
MNKLRHHHQNALARCSRRSQPQEWDMQKPKIPNAYRAQVYRLLDICMLRDIYRIFNFLSVSCDDVRLQRTVVRAQCLSKVYHARPEYQSISGHINMSPRCADMASFAVAPR